MTFPGLARRWNSWSDLLSLQDEMNRLFESTMGSAPRAALLGTDYIPPVDVYRTKEGLLVKIDLPGMKRDDIEITFVNGRLSVRGEKKNKEAKEPGSAHRVERFYGIFERVIDLPEPVDAEKVTATFVDGVLEIAAPLREEAKPRQIAVEVK